MEKTIVLTSQAFMESKVNQSKMPSTISTISELCLLFVHAIALVKGQLCVVDYVKVFPSVFYLSHRI